MDTRQHHSNDFLTLTPTGATSLVFSGLSRGGGGGAERGRKGVSHLSSLKSQGLPSSFPGHIAYFSKQGILLLPSPESAVAVIQVLYYQQGGTISC